DAVAEGDAAVAGEARVCESLHAARIIPRRAGPERPGLQERFDLLLELVFRGHARVFFADFSVAPDHDCRRNSPDWPERILHVVVTEALQYRVIHLVLGDIRLQLLELVVDRDADELQALRSVAVLQFD